MDGGAALLLIYLLSAGQLLAENETAAAVSFEYQLEGNTP